MAIERDHTFPGGIVVQGIYWTFGVIELRVFDELARLELWPYLSEDLRRQQLTDEQRALSVEEQMLLLVPIRVPGLEKKIVNVPGVYYQQYFAASSHDGGRQNIVEAAWRYVTEIAEPHGLKEFFANGKRV